MMSKAWRIDLEEWDDHVEYTVRWSPWGSMDKWVINRIVPSEAGLYQLWTMDGHGLLLQATEPTFYGGLRNCLREIIDEMVPAGRYMREKIGNRESWFRFSTSPVKEQLQSLRNWFSSSQGAYDEDNREVLVNEIETLSRFPSPPPDLKTEGRKRMQDSDFGPPLPNHTL